MCHCLMVVCVMGSGGLSLMVVLCVIVWWWFVSLVMVCY